MNKVYLLLLFPILGEAAENLPAQLYNELEQTINGCVGAVEEKICVSSIDQRNEEILVYLRSQVYQEVEFEKKQAVNTIAPDANRIYASFDRRTLDFTHGDLYPITLSSSTLTQIKDKAVVIISYEFSDRSVSAIHDNNDSLYIDFENRLDVYNMLQTHRQRMGSKKRSYFDSNYIEDYYTLIGEINVKSTYKVLSAPAVKNIDTGEVTVTGKKSYKGKQVTHVSTVGYEVSYFNLD